MLFYCLGSVCEGTEVWEVRAGCPTQPVCRTGVGRSSAAQLVIRVQCCAARDAVTHISKIIIYPSVLLDAGRPNEMVSCEGKLETLAWQLCSVAVTDCSPQ